MENKSSMSKFVNIIYCISRFQHGKVQILQYRARELSSGGREGGISAVQLHKEGVWTWILLIFCIILFLFFFFLILSRISLYLNSVIFIHKWTSRTCDSRESVFSFFFLSYFFLRGIGNSVLLLGKTNKIIELLILEIGALTKRMTR